MSKYLSSFEKYAVVCKNSAYRIQSVAGYSQVFTKDCNNHGFHQPGKLGGLRCTKCEKYRRAEGVKAKQVIKGRAEKFLKMEIALCSVELTEQQGLEMKNFLKTPITSLSTKGVELKGNISRHCVYFDAV